MDTFDIKFEKRNAMLKQHQLCKIGNLVRFVEVFVLLVLISRFTTHVPLAVKSSGEYFRGLSVILVSPHFVFIVGNAIVITLFAKAGQFSAHGSTSRSNLYEEIVVKSEKNHQAVHVWEIERKSEEEIGSSNVHGSKGTKNIRRTKSENLKRTKSDKQYCQQLRRLGSEKYVKPNDSEDESVKSSCNEEGMSNEQFRDTVEAFIARQKMIRREEEYSVIWKDSE